MSKRPSPASYGAWPDGPFESADDPVVAQAAAQLATVARALHEARLRDRRNTQERLARRTGVSRYTLSRLEAGSTWADLAIILRLCVELGLELRIVRTANDA